VFIISREQSMVGTEATLTMQLSLEQRNSHTIEEYSLYRNNNTAESRSRSSHGRTRIPTSPCVCLQTLFLMVSNANGPLPSAPISMQLFLAP
jgi:hypothetical protein